MRSPRSARSCLVWLAAAFAALAALEPCVLLAQKAPEVGYAYPPGARAGTTVEVVLGAYDLTPDTEFFCHTPDVRLTLVSELGEPITQAPPYWFGPRSRENAMPIPREFRARLELPADLPPGPIYWQAANANGASATASFEISVAGDGREIRESRWRDQAQIVESLPAIVSGRLERIAEVDRYRVRAKVDGPVSLDLRARRVGADFHGVVEVRDSTGRLVADVADTEGCDAALTFAARRDEVYEIAVHDLEYRGHRSFVYRLHLRAGPRVCVSLPAFGRFGETRDVRIVGYGVATGSSRLEAVARRIRFPSEPGAASRYRLEAAFGAAAPFDLLASPLEELVDSSSREEGQVRDVPAPGAITRTMLSASRHRHVFTTRKDEAWKIRAESRAIGSYLDLQLSVHSEDGKKLAENDDANGSTDAELVFRAPSEGRHVITVVDVSGKIGALDAIYRLVLERPSPGLELTTPLQVTVPSGGKGALKVVAQRRGGVEGPISLALSGLPEGYVVAGDLVIPAGKSEISISLEATDAAGTPAALLQVRGQLLHEGRQLSAIATAPASGHRFARRPGACRVPSCLLATTLKPPFRFDVVGRQRQRAVHRGTTYPAPIVIEREDGFDGEVELQMLAKQGRHRQGIRSPAVTVPSGESRVPYPIFLPEWLETDRTTRMVVLGMAKVADSTGRLRYVARPITSRITMILEGALLKLSRANRGGLARELRAAPGETLEIPVRVQRAAKFRGSVQVELVPSKELAALVKSASILVAGDQADATLRVVTRPDSRLLGDWSWTLRARGLIDERWPVVSDLEVPITFSKVTTGGR